MTDERILAWLRLMPRKANGAYDVEHFTVLDVEACIRGAVKEAEEKARNDAYNNGYLEAQRVATEAGMTELHQRCAEIRRKWK